MNENIQNEAPAVPYVVHESAQARLERQIKRLWGVAIAAIVALFISNMVWLYCWMQYDYVSDTYTIESQDGGNANFIGNDGDITNGQNSSQKDLPDAENQQLP